MYVFQTKKVRKMSEEEKKIELEIMMYPRSRWDLENFLKAFEEKRKFIIENWWWDKATIFLILKEVDTDE